MTNSHLGTNGKCDNQIRCTGVVKNRREYWQLSDVGSRKGLPRWRSDGRIFLDRHSGIGRSRERCRTRYDENGARISDARHILGIKSGGGTQAGNETGSEAKRYIWHRTPEGCHYTQIR